MMCDVTTKELCNQGMAKSKNDVTKEYVTKEWCNMCNQGMV